MSGFDTYPVLIGDHKQSCQSVDDNPPGPPHADYPCRSDGRCQYAIDHGAEGLGHCPRGKCVMAAEYQRDAIASAQSEQAFADNQRAYSART